jgi:hypothetical protein
MAYLSPQRKLLKFAPFPLCMRGAAQGENGQGFAMVGIFRRIWSALWLWLLSGLGPEPQVNTRPGLRRSVGQMPTPSHPSVSPAAGAAQVSDSSATETCHPAQNILPKAALTKAHLPEALLPEARPAKLFYSLMVEVNPEEADAETLQLFSSEACFTLADALNLPAGCKLRRCMYVSPEFAEMLIIM